ncbi:cupin domain-containing protein [Phycicoccus jejuensis]|uniref:cupin domain-containing protein n=1 Tax=Phycicoccus jejuensis TaxID=367299 RepID=UPI0004C2C219|nr:cupin domain-containing protein [Phycicoccus jejuensis]
MDSTSLTALGDEVLAVARESVAGRASRTIHGGHDRMLRETVIALVAEHELAEHESPGEATLQVLRGRVRLRTSGGEREAGAADHLVIPPRRHSLFAVEDSVVLLTVVKPLS